MDSVERLFEKRIKVLERAIRDEHYDKRFIAHCRRKYDLDLGGLSNKEKLIQCLNKDFDKQHRWAVTCRYNDEVNKCKIPIYFSLFDKYANLCSLFIANGNFNHLAFKVAINRELDMHEKYMETLVEPGEDATQMEIDIYRHLKESADVRLDELQLQVAHDIRRVRSDYEPTLLPEHHLGMSMQISNICNVPPFLHDGTMDVKYTH